MKKRAKRSFTKTEEDAGVEAIAAINIEGPANYKKLVAAATTEGCPYALELLNDFFPPRMRAGWDLLGATPFDHCDFSSEHVDIVLKLEYSSFVTNSNGYFQYKEKGTDLKLFAKAMAMERKAADALRPWILK